MTEAELRDASHARYADAVVLTIAP